MVGARLGVARTRAAARRPRASTATATATATPRPRRNTQRILAALAGTPIKAALKRLVTASSGLRVLGLDINTNSTGYAVLGGDGRVVRWGHIATTQHASADVLGIAHAITTELAAIRTTAPGARNGPDGQWLVGIEDFMRMYRFGQFHNKGIFQLAQLNGIVSYGCWQEFNTRPVHTHPSAARGFFGIVAAPSRTPKGSASSIKDEVMAFALARESDLAAAAMERNPSSGAWRETAFDIADAYVVASHTRWMHMQHQLSSDAALAEAFARAYVGVLNPTGEIKPKSKLTAEEKALEAMPTDKRRTYLHELFVLGLSEWIKQEAARVNSDNC